jgi:archaellum component FlaC
MSLSVGTLKMSIKDLWEGTSSWLRSHGLSRDAGRQPEIDDQGLLSQDAESTESGADEPGVVGGQGNNNVIVRAAQPADKSQSLEKLQEGFDNLIGQLQDINEHLNRQVTQHQELMGRIEKLPQWLESFPGVVENQKQITEQLLEQLKSTTVRQEQFMDSVQKIPTETAKQTDALVDIDHQLAAAADTDVQMAESFNKFNQTLDKLNQSTEGQTDSILTMSKTFAASDRYLKYIISRQNKRFMWIFIASVSVCVAVILILVGIIIYINE